MLLLISNLPVSEKDEAQIDGLVRDFSKDVFSRAHPQCSRLSHLRKGAAYTKLLPNTR